RFAQGGRSDGVHRYRADVLPRLWLLSLGSDYRIFQEKTVPEIVKTLLAEHGVAEVRDELTGSYAPRDYCVQHGESTLDFVSRLLEEEGIFYFFEHARGKHTLVLGDDSGSHRALSPGEIPLLPAFAEREVEDTLAECGLRKQL